MGSGRNVDGNRTKAVAIITARGGSKRIPGKNKKEFLGKPIIRVYRQWLQAVITGSAAKSVGGYAVFGGK